MAQMGITLDDKQADAFVRYYEMLIEKNKVMNLTAITDPEEVLVSISLTAWLPECLREDSLM